MGVDSPDFRKTKLVLLDIRQQTKSPIIDEAFSLEVQQGSKLYIIPNELMRWRELLDTNFRRYKLENRRREA